MAHKIKFCIFANPLPDSDGNTTYQVRHQPDGTMNTKAFLDHVKLHESFNTTAMSSALHILKDEIVEQLKNNKRFRIDGIGTFQMKVGLKNTTDENGTSMKAHFTDPEMITARNVEVTGVSFIPDKSLITKLKNDTSTANSNGRGVVGRSKQYERQDVVNALNAYLAEHHFITRRTLQTLLHLSSYAAQKWLNLLINEEFPKYTAQKEGNTIIYRRYGKE
jgi:nucleoid DNA-binding protein